MGTVAAKLRRAGASKADIAAAIREQGGSITPQTPFSAYAAAVEGLVLAGGGGRMQEKTLLPTGEAVTAVPDEGFTALSAVIQPPMNTLHPWNLRRGVTVLDVTGTADLE